MDTGKKQIANILPSTNNESGCAWYVVVNNNNK